MTPPNLDNLRAARRFAKQDYDRQVVAQGGSPSQDYSAAGPPTWDRATWDAYRRQYGRPMFSASELPPTFAGAPSWVYQEMGLREPPIGFHEV